MNCPDLEKVRQKFFDEIVEDFPIDDQPPGGQRLDRVVQQQERPVLRDAVLALNPGQKSRKKLRPVTWYIEPRIKPLLGTYNFKRPLEALLN